MKRKTEKEIQDDFYRIYGDAMSIWSTIEYVLSFWFSYASGTTPAMADRIMSSAKSFNAKTGMLDAAFYGTHHNVDLTSFFRAAMKTTRNYSDFRNKLAHNQFMFIKQDKRMVIARRADPFWEHDVVSVGQLLAGARNFFWLKTAWLYALPTALPKPVLTPKQGLRLIHALPKSADSKVAVRSVPRRLRPFLATT
jgi:hypothetical protein